MQMYEVKKMLNVVKFLTIYYLEQDLGLVTNPQTAKLKPYEYHSWNFAFAHQTNSIVYGKSCAIV